MDAAGHLKELLMREPRWSVAAAESLTCGRVQAKIGSVSGASAYFRGGITAYSIEEKVRLLGVDRALAEAVDSVSREIAEQMARGACLAFGSDVALATTGYAEPNPSRGVPYPMAWWSVWHDLRDGRAAVRSGMLDLPGADRIRAQETVAAAALGELVNYLRTARG